MADEEDNSVSSDGDVSPRTGFQARLERLRRNAQGKRRAEQGVASGSDDDSSEEVDGNFATWADETDDFIASIQVSCLLRSRYNWYNVHVIDQNLLDEEEDIVSGHDRKARKKLFRSIHNGDFGGQAS
jgi:hypothetical protein